MLNELTLFHQQIHSLKMGIITKPVQREYAVSKNEPRAAGQVVTLVPFGKVKVWSALTTQRNYHHDPGTHEIYLHIQIYVYPSHGSTDRRQAGIHDRLCPFKLILSNDSVGIETEGGSCESWTTKTVVSARTPLPRGETHRP